MAPRPPRTSGSVRAGNRKTVDDEDTEALKRELEHEKRLRDTIEWSNTELERSIQELEDELESLEKISPPSDPGCVLGVSPGQAMNEWWVRLEAQLAVNQQLEQSRKWLELELEQARQQAAAGSFPEAMNFDLDSLTEAELIRLVKHLERGRTDLYSTLRDCEWKLDKEGKDYHRLAETRSMYQAELRHYTRTLDRLRSQQLHQGLEQGGGVPLPGPPLPQQGVTRWAGSAGIKSNQRIIDPKKGPIKKTVGVRNLPKLQQHKKDGGGGGGGGRKSQRRGKSRATSCEPSSEDKLASAGTKEETSSPQVTTEGTTDDSGVVLAKQQEALAVAGNKEGQQQLREEEEAKQDTEDGTSKDDTEDKDTEE